MLVTRDTWELDDKTSNMPACIHLRFCVVVELLLVTVFFFMSVSQEPEEAF